MYRDERESDRGERGVEKFDALGNSDAIINLPLMNTLVITTMKKKRVIFQFGP